MSHRWAVVGVPDRLADGGTLRARHLFRELIARTNALEFYRPGLAMMGRTLRHPGSILPGVNIAAAELLPQATVELASRMTRLRVLDLHDHPTLQREAFGLGFDKNERQQLNRLVATNEQAFETVIGVSESFLALAQVATGKGWVVPNGTDTSTIRPGPWPIEPAVGFVSGAAPGRGIEGLVDAVRLVREEIPARLLLALVATGIESREYLRELCDRLAPDQWVSIESVPYTDLGTFLSRCSALAIPHPAGPYMDAALPVKLFDSMAAGRPLIVTPRFETVRVVAATGCGVVARSDEPTDLAGAIVASLRDESAARRMGSAGRIAAEERYDWRVLGNAVANRFAPAQTV